jgi:A/G-specific adenine glycosylase
MHNIAGVLLSWYRAHHRDLPWRHTRNPYKIWLSEIILQQTRVDQGIEYYHRFVDRFPTVEGLAAADLQTVLRLWQGLGYYTRARNLHKCAVHIVEKHHGRFPTTFHALQQLPGVGRYTAAAIASFAFGQRVPAIDANAIRVLSRLFLIAEESGSTQSIQSAFKIAEEIMPSSKPDVFNQALMEFGALQCVPKTPVCTRCALKLYCGAYGNGRVAEFPVRPQKKEKKVRFFTYYVIETDTGFVMHRRDGKDIWHGLYEFYLVENDRHIPPGETEDAFIRRLMDQGATVGACRQIRHVLTHQVIVASFHHIRTKTVGRLPRHPERQYVECPSDTINTLPKPILIVRYLEEMGL